MGFSNKDDHQHHVDYEADMYTGITTFHGLVRIYNSRNWWGRIFWIWISFLAMSMFFIQSYYTLEAYHGKPTTIMSRFSVPVDGIEFPDITICNFSPVNQRRVEMNYPTMKEDVQRYIMWSYLQVENLYSQVDEKDFNRSHDAYMEYKKEYYALNETEFEIPDFFKNTGFLCDEMFKECTFGGIKIANCCDYAHATLTDIGLCYKFKEFGENKWTQSQLISGAYYGLHMIIDAQVDSYPELFVENFLDSGVKFYIHPDGVIPMLSSMGSAIPQGRKGFGAVTLRQFNFLEQGNWGDCRTDFDPGQLNHTGHVDYHSGNCETLCIANYFMENCSCVPLRYLINESMPVCTPMDMYRCINVSHMTGDERFLRSDYRPAIQSLVGEFLEESETYWYRSCSCTIECKKQDYDVEMSFSHFPNQAAAQGLAAKFGANASQVRDNYLVLNVYMKEIIRQNYTQQKQLSRTGVLSDVGGNMGMFLGMSVITLGEIFIFFLKCCWGTSVQQRRVDLARREREAADAEATDAPAPEAKGPSRLALPGTSKAPERSPGSPREYSGPNRYQTVYSEVSKGRKRSIVPSMTRSQETPTISAVDHEKWLKEQLSV